MLTPRMCLVVVAMAWSMCDGFAQSPPASGEKPGGNSLPQYRAEEKEWGRDVRVAAAEVDWVDDSAVKEFSLLEARVRGLFEEERFDELDQLAQELREKRVMNADGWWLLPSFYWDLHKRYDDNEKGLVADWARFVRWIEHNPKSLTARIALAEFFVIYAGRGKRALKGGEGEAIYTERMNQAYEILMEARKLPDKDPFWHMVMGRVAQGQKWPAERFDEMLEEGLQMEPTFPALITTRAKTLRGKTGQWETYADKEYRRAGGLGVESYARIVMLMPKSYKNVFTETKASWPLTREGLLTMRKKYPDSQEIINNTALLASLAGDQDLAREMFSLMGNSYDPHVWKDVLQVARFRIWAETGKW